MFISFVGCGGDKKEYIDMPFDREKTPTMTVDSVTELVSDSGLVRYKLITPKWLSFENSSDPHWFFPEGLYIEQFDTAFQKQVTIKSDTAWNYTQRKLIRWVGNVFVHSAQDETFESEELFWDERNGRVYSDKYIKITQPGKLILHGKGFESDQRMTNYRIFRPFDSEVLVNEEEVSTTKADTLSQIAEP